MSHKLDPCVWYSNALTIKLPDTSMPGIKMNPDFECQVFRLLLYLHYQSNKIDWIHKKSGQYVLPYVKLYY